MPEETPPDDFVSKIMSELGATYEDARQFAESYRRMMADDPEEALAMLETYLEEARSPGPNREHRAFVEATAGGPNPDYVVPIINVVETIYSGLEMEQRAVILKKIMSYLDDLNLLNAQGHVEQMDNPHLVADITANRPGYWPGLRPYLDFLETDPDWEEVEQRFESAPSRFLFAFTMLREGCATEATRQRFYAAYPAMLDATLDALAVRIHCHALYKADKPDDSYDEAVDRQFEYYDPDIRTELVLRLTEPKYVRLDLPS